MKPEVNVIIETNIKRFLKEWLEWANIGGIEHGVFEQVGLCSSIENWVDHNYPDTALPDIDQIYTSATYRSHLIGMIRNAGYAELAFPFDGHSANYLAAMIGGTIHTNPMRLEFVKAHM